MSCVLVSIIIVTYKNFDIVYDSIQSVLNQDYENFELIIADDGSPTFPRKEIEDFINNNKSQNLVSYVVYSNEHNLGTVRNLNNAHRKASGEYTIELAGDDLFYDNYVVSSVVSRMEKTHCDVLATSRLVVGNDSKPLYYFPHVVFRNKLKKMTRFQQYERFVSGQIFASLSGSAVAFRENQFKRMGLYDEKYTLFEDGPFFEKYLKRDKIEQAYDIVQTRYSLGGVSTGKIHPKLIEDNAVYDKTDRISNLDSVSPFFRALTLYNVNKSIISRIKKVGIWFLPVLVYKVVYKTAWSCGEIIDKMIIKKGKKL